MGRKGTFGDVEFNEEGMENLKKFAKEAVSPLLPRGADVPKPTYEELPDGKLLVTVGFPNGLEVETVIVSGWRWLVDPTNN